MLLHNTVTQILNNLPTTRKTTIITDDRILKYAEAIDEVTGKPSGTAEKAIAHWQACLDLDEERLERLAVALLVDGLTERQLHFCPVCCAA